MLPRYFKLDKIFLIASLILFSSAAAAEKIIRFATEATYPPFEFIDESGKIKGFDIEVAQALCAQLHAQCVFSNEAFNSLIPSLKLGKIDALIAAIGVTPERQAQVAFTNMYYVPGASFVAAGNKHYTLKEIAGKTIGVQQGTLFKKYLRDQYGDKIKIKSYASIQDAFLDLTAERMDAVLTDSTIAETWLKQNKNHDQYEVIEKTIVDQKHFGSGYGIAVRKNDAALLQDLNVALAKIKKNGTYATIMKKYF